jgi:enediyne biosynthesis protein E4
MSLPRQRQVFGAGLLAALLPLAPVASGSPPEPGEAFIDRAAELGLRFTYSNGGTGELYYPEIIGGGAALFDYDNDGDLDVFLVQGAPLAPGASASALGARASATPNPPRGRLFRNDLRRSPDGRMEPHFVDVTDKAGIVARGDGMGVATGDYDNDGWVDLYLLNYGGNQLWHNNGNGTFTEVTATAAAGESRFSLSASFADFDRDGWLDLYIANYVEFSVAGNVRCFAPSSRRDYCSPSAFPPAPDRLLRNRGNGTFVDVSLPAGIASKAGRGMGVVADDFDGDGWPDLFVTNDGTANFLWKNRHDFTFEEVALPAGVALNADGREQANMGIAAGDVDGDGDDDLFVTHLAGETSTLFVNDGHGTFADRTVPTRLAAATYPYTGFGAGFLDYDNDGRLDLLVANGAVSLIEEQAAKGSAYPYAQTPQLLRNMGDGRFADVSGTAGETFHRAGVGRGVAFGDVDNDGGMDALIVDSNGPVRLLLNQVGHRQPWLGLSLRGRPKAARGERDMLGARVAVLRRNAPTLWRRAATDGSYASANDPRVLVGLGEAAETPAVTEVRVFWPDGKSESFPPPTLRQYSKLVQGTGHPVPPATPRKPAKSPGGHR